jgi:putative hydrolase of the HAD superfamily
MIRAVLFDLDGTLYDRDAAMEAFAHEQFSAFKDQLPNVDVQQFLARFLEFDEHGYAKRFDLYRRLGDEFRLDRALTVELERHFWDCYSRACEATADTWTTLRALKAAGKTIGVITNGETKWQMTKLDALGMRDVFDIVLVSEAEGISKPDAAIFARALDRCGVAPAEAMFVGDNPEIDVAGAKAAGLAAVWKRVPYWTLTVDGVLVVDRLSEILPWSA